MEDVISILFHLTYYTLHILMITERKAMYITLQFSERGYQKVAFRHYLQGLGFQVQEPTGVDLP